MIASAPVHEGLELRSARAETLAAGAPAAREPLLFVATLFRAQAGIDGDERGGEDAFAEKSL